MKKKIQFDFDEFTNWFNDISEYIANARTNEEVPDGGGSISQFLDNDGTIKERCSLWFGDQPPDIDTYIILKGELIE